MKIDVLKRVKELMSDKNIATMMGLSDYEMIFISKEAVNNQPEDKVDCPIEYKARFYCSTTPTGQPRLIYMENMKDGPEYWLDREIVDDVKLIKKICDCAGCFNPC